MKKIDNIGNLPRHMVAFAKSLGGTFSEVPSTEFYEMSSIDEFEKNATEVGYEIVPTVDTSTGRGFLVGFDITEPKRIVTLHSYCQMKIYFVSCTDTDIKSWTRKILSHRDDQQRDMRSRRDTAQEAKRRKKPITVRSYDD